MLDQRGQLLPAAVGFAGCSMRRTIARSGTAHLARLLAGHRHVAVGMHRQGFDLQLTQYDERGWRATRAGGHFGLMPYTSAWLTVRVAAR